MDAVVGQGLEAPGETRLGAVLRLNFAWETSFIHSETSSGHNVLQLNLHNSEIVSMFPCEQPKRVATLLDSKVANQWDPPRHMS